MGICHVQLVLYNYLRVLVPICSDICTIPMIMRNIYTPDVYEEIGST